MLNNILTNPKEILNWFSTRPRIVAFDTETTSLSYLDLELVGMSFCDGQRACYINYWSMSDVDKLFTINYMFVYLSECVDLVIMHNAPYDLKVLFKYGITPTEQVFCTMTAAHLLDETGPKSLKVLATTLLGVTDVATYEESVKYGYNSEEFMQYATNDAIWTYQLYKRFDSQLRRQELDRLFYKEEMPFQFVLRDLEVNGLNINQVELARMREEVEPICKELYQDLYDISGTPYYIQHDLFGGSALISKINLNNAQRCADVIVDKLGISMFEKTPGGQLSADKWALKRLAGQHIFIDKLAEYRRYSKLLSSVLNKWPGMIDADGRMRVGFNNCVAVTGRLSSGMQQLAKEGTLPREPRQLIEAPEGYAFVVADYAGQELRVLAHVSQDKGMIEAFLKKMDLHLATANNFYKLGMPDECLVTAHPDYESYKDKFSKKRSNAKIINFGIAYGKTAIGFAADFNVDRDEAEKIVEAYFKACPSVKNAIENNTKQLRRTGYVANLAGRRRRLGKHRYTGRAKRQAFNFLIQSYSADMMKIAMARVRPILLEHPEWDAKLVLTVHDEMVIECKEEYKEEIGEMVEYEMEHAMKLSVPLVADVSYGKTYGDAK